MPLGKEKEKGKSEKRVGEMCIPTRVLRSKGSLKNVPTDLISRQAAFGPLAHESQQKCEHSESLKGFGSAGVLSTNRE